MKALTGAGKREVWRGRGKEMEKTSIDLKRAGEDLSGGVHQLPCCVKHNGPAPVSHYFKAKPSPEGFQLQAHFRGRLLQGTTLPLPHGFSGFVLSKATSPTSSPHWHTNATFHNITYWNHDYAPSHNDELFRAFHWLTLAQSLHNPVTPEELASSSVTLYR